MDARIPSARNGEPLSRYDTRKKDSPSYNMSVMQDKQDPKEEDRLFQSPALLREKVNKVQEMSDLMGHSLQFDVREEADIVQIVVKESSSGDVIKEIPPERIVKFLESMKELLGSLFDEKF